MADQSDEEDSEGLFEAMIENEYFQRVYGKYCNLKSFLMREELIYARSVTAERAEQHVFLQFMTDVDGCVVELKSLRGIKIPVRHLTFMPNGVISVKGIHSMLKKHIDLSLYTRAQLVNFNHSVGFQLFYEHGWECWIGMIPSRDKRGSELLANIQKELCVRHFQKIKTGFQKKLQELCFKGKALRTLMKNDMNHVEKMFVLPDDCETILSALQNVIDECLVERDFELVLFCFRFGEKMRGGLSLKKFKTNEVRRVTVHSAIDVSSEDMDLLWSRSGLQSVVGERGVLSTCLTFSDCANFQSNLDGRAIDVSKDIRTICHHPDKLRFVQFYSDIAHRRPTTRFHPVSGYIAGGMAFHKLTSAAFKKDAAEYLSCLQNNFRLMTRSTCRLECVTELIEVKDVVMASDCLNIHQVYDLLESKPLLVPFPIGMMKCVQEVGLGLVSELSALLDVYACTGNIGAVWKAFQLELSAEKMIWGYPLCFRSQHLSVNLGPGQLAISRSRTDYFGFLALERWTACMANENSLPPCSIWTASEVMAEKIIRCAGIHDILPSSTFVLGRRILDTLIKDLFVIGKLGTGIRFEEFKKELFSVKATKVKVTGAVTTKQLAAILGGKRRLPVSMAYGNIYDMLEKYKIDIQGVLKDGLVELGLTYFPAVQTWDVHRNPILNWSSVSGLWKIIGREGSETEYHSNSEALSLLVVSELERRHLVYVSKLKKVPSTFPWITECNRKLSGEKLSEEGLVKVLSFVSCVALLMNGWYVQYESMEKLMRELPLNQYRLRDLEIQSKFLLSHMNLYKVFRLHHSIPFRLEPFEKETARKVREEPAECNENVNFEVEGECHKIPEEEIIVQDQNVSMRAATCLPLGANCNKRWTAKELEILDDVRSGRSEKVPHTSLYEVFKQKCIENGISFRTFKSFNSKLSRM